MDTTTYFDIAYNTFDLKKVFFLTETRKRLFDLSRHSNEALVAD
jgi:hypothetical protein